MKIRRLPDIDLARIAVLPIDEQRHRLKKMRFGRPPHTYAPTRKCLPDILNEQSPLLGDTEITPWDKIEGRLKTESNHEKEFQFNCAVSKALYGHAVNNLIVSRRKPIPKWSVGISQNVSFWWDLYTVIEGQASFPFMDPRISSPLTKEARRFAFSIMHERIRVPDPDFADIGLTIIQFAKADDGERLIRLHDVEEVDLIDFDKLNEMVNITYRIWVEVLEDREDETRKTGTNDMGPLFQQY